MGTIDFLHGPGCSVDLVCRLPTLCINTDVLCLTNGTLQKAEGGGGCLFVFRGHLRRRYLLRFAVDEKRCVSKLMRTSVYKCVHACVFQKSERQT